MTTQASHNTPAETWEQTFGRVGFFAIALMASILPLRSLPLAQARPILDEVQNCSLLLLAIALPAYAWCAVRRRRAGGMNPAGFRLGATLALLGVTLSVFATALLLRANLVELAYQRGAPLAIFGVQAIEIAGGLVVPILAVFTLVMMPYISAEALRRAARIVAGVCILTLAPLPLAAWLTALHPASRGNSAAPVHRQFTHGKLPV